MPLHQLAGRRDRSCPTPPETAACVWGNSSGIRDKARRFFCSLRRDRAEFHPPRDAPIRILPDPCFGREESAACLPVRLRSFGPSSPDRVPALAQPFLIGVPVLGNDRRNTLGMLQCQPKASRRPIVEYVNRKTLQADNLGKTIDDVRDILECIVELIAIRHVRLTKPRKVGRDDMELLRELRHEFTEHMTCTRKSVK